jgi:hypothetical protein
MKHVSIKSTLGLAFLLSVASVSLHPTSAHAQAPAAGALSLTAKSANVADSGTPVKISILRWSNDQERKPVVDALDPAAQAAQAAASAGGRGGGRGGRGGRGGLDPNDPAMADVDATPARGRGGRGDATPPKPPDPIATLTGALGKAPTVGYLWTNEVVGYSIKYAHRMQQRDGSERIILITDRRLGAGTVGWTPKAGGAPTDYQFTLIEVRIDPKGVGEGRASLTSKVILDNEAKTLALDNYAATPAIFQNVTR